MDDEIPAQSPHPDDDHAGRILPGVPPWVERRPFPQHRPGSVLVDVEEIDHGRTGHPGLHRALEHPAQLDIDDVYGHGQWLLAAALGHPPRGNAHLRIRSVLAADGYEASGPSDARLPQRLHIGRIARKHDGPRPAAPTDEGIQGIPLDDHHPIAALPERFREGKPLFAQPAKNDVVLPEAQPQELEMVAEDRRQRLYRGERRDGRGQKPRHLQFPRHRRIDETRLHGEELQGEVQCVAERPGITAEGVVRCKPDMPETEGKNPRRPEDGPPEIAPPLHE